MRNYINIIESNMLMELFRDPFEWKWIETSKKELGAIFNTDSGNEGQVLFIRIPFVEPVDEDDWVWAVDFSIDDSVTITGGGESYKIFATVVDIIKDVIRSSVKSPVFAFDATNSTGTLIDSRTKLYSAMLKKLADSVNYNFEIRVDKPKTYFFLKPK